MPAQDTNIQLENQLENQVVVANNVRNRDTPIRRVNKCLVCGLMLIVVSFVPMSFYFKYSTDNIYTMADLSAANQTVYEFCDNTDCYVSMQNCSTTISLIEVGGVANLCSVISKNECMTKCNEVFNNWYYVKWHIGKDGAREENETANKYNVAWMILLVFGIACVCISALKR